MSQRPPAAIRECLPSPFLSFPASNTRPLLPAFIGAALLITATAWAEATTDRPAAPPSSAGATRAAPAFHITAPRPINGRGEWTPPESEDGFLSTTRVVCTAAVGDEAPGTESDAVSGESSRITHHPSRISWRVTVFRGGRSVGAITGSGSPFTFRAADASPRRYSGPLAVEIRAELEASDAAQGEGSGGCAPRAAADQVRLQQDEIDQLRQEYLDLPGRKLALVPRRAFVDRTGYERAGALSIPWPDLNRTQRRAGGAYRYILFTDALRDGLRRWQEQLGARALTISSGFRNPFKQSITNTRRGGHEGAQGSMHQYGRAVDVRASLRRDFRDWVQVAWAALDAGADYVETAPEGGANHVHADWRHDGQGPPLTVKLEIAGRVVDSEGHPVPTARILGASDAAAGAPGMPAWEGPDAEGRFVLRTVWRPGRPYRLRAQAEQGSATQVVTVPEPAAVPPGPPEQQTSETESDDQEGRAPAVPVVRLQTELVLSPEAVRAALARRRPVRLASRGGRSYWGRRRYARR